MGLVGVFKYGATKDMDDRIKTLKEVGNKNKYYSCYLESEYGGQFEVIIHLMRCVLWKHNHESFEKANSLVGLWTYNVFLWVLSDVVNEMLK